MWTAIFIIILVYLLTRFVFGFVLPLLKATRQVRGKMQQMRDQMNGQQSANGPTNFGGQYTGSNQPNSTSSRDYIEFEEIKE